MPAHGKERRKGIVVAGIVVDERDQADDDGAESEEVRETISKPEVPGVVRVAIDGR